MVVYMVVWLYVIIYGVTFKWVFPPEDCIILSGEYATNFIPMKFNFGNPLYVFCLSEIFSPIKSHRVELVNHLNNNIPHPQSRVSHTAILHEQSYSCNISIPFYPTGTVSFGNSHACQRAHRVGTQADATYIA
ncbi:hypothetical protein LOAG_14588 [Loa loa]|uniref:Uncharacterized protein n=1 Tax=Loa loa TaxID=7209 RepID=A0A1S0TI05_LOALO|nr:hypothetical protein LOAG_14588 [Loa loa]EFO13938.1 hypothetical protein LOAG_14588 [Loa loa]